MSCFKGEGCKMQSDIIKETNVFSQELLLKLPKSRSKIVAALLNPIIEMNLGFSLKSMAFKVVQSILIATNIYIEKDSKAVISTDDISEQTVKHIIKSIEEFFSSATNKKREFNELYKELESLEANKEVIPIYVAIVFRQYMKNAIILKNNIERLVTPETIELIHQSPCDFELQTQQWNEKKESYLMELQKIFCCESSIECYDFNLSYNVVQAMCRWLYGLPKYSIIGTQKYVGDGKFIPLKHEAIKLKNSLKISDTNSMEYILKKLPALLGASDPSVDILDKLKQIKEELTNHLEELKTQLIDDVKALFGADTNISMAYSLKNWAETLNESSKNCAFSNGEEKILNIINIASNDKSLIEKLTVFITGVSLEYWQDGTPLVFLRRLKEIKNMLENDCSNETYTYTLQIVDESRNIVKTFSKTSYTNQSVLFSNELTNLIEDYGTSMNIGEKRQVLLDVLQNL